MLQSHHVPRTLDLLSSPLATSQHDWIETASNTIYRAYPNGFVFSATAVRLLSEKVGFIIDDEMKAVLQQQMFSPGDDLWFFPDAFADSNTRQQLLVTAMQWLTKWQFFSLAALYESTRYYISDKCDTIEAFESFYTWLAKSVPTLSDTRTVSYWNMFRIVRAKDINCDRAFAKISGEHIKLTIEGAGGLVSESDLLKEYPLLDSGLLSAIIKEYMPWAIKTEVGGLICFQSAYHLGLPVDFSDRLSAVIARLEQIGLPVSDDNLHTALSLELGMHFCKEYNIPRRAFRMFIEHQYTDQAKRSWSGGVFAEVTG
ncbi:MAG: hypothetical protein M0Z41_08455 [Peptococcaceae bacterium]|nr:hypothetical protein [Peptococcaceae bacterium]